MIELHARGNSSASSLRCSVRALHYKVEPGIAFTLELWIDNVDGRGYLGVGEMVLVTTKGCEFLSNAQSALPVL